MLKVKLSLLSYDMILYKRNSNDSTNLESHTNLVKVAGYKNKTENCGICIYQQQILK